MLRAKAYAANVVDAIRAKREENLLRRTRRLHMHDEASAAAVSGMGMDIETGHARMTALIRLIALFDKSDELFLEPMQKLIAHKIIHAFASVVYGPVLYAMYETEIRRKFGIAKGTTSEYAVALARRMGKTVTISVVIAAWLLTQPGKNVIIFSKAAKQSEDVVAKVKTNIMHFMRLAKLDTKGYRIKACSTDHIVIQHPCGSETMVKATGSAPVRYVGGRVRGPSRPRRHGTRFCFRRKRAYSSSPCHELPDELTSM